LARNYKLFNLGYGTLGGKKTPTAGVGKEEMLKKRVEKKKTAGITARTGTCECIGCQAAGEKKLEEEKKFCNLTCGLSHAGRETRGGAYEQGTLTKERKKRESTICWVGEVERRPKVRGGAMEDVLVTPLGGGKEKRISWGAVEGKDRG